MKSPGLRKNTNAIPAGGIYGDMRPWTLVLSMIVYFAINVPVSSRSSEWMEFWGKYQIEPQN